jgi:hypothetical protein
MHNTCTLPVHDWAPAPWDHVRATHASPLAASLTAAPRALSRSRDHGGIRLQPDSLATTGADLYEGLARRRRRAQIAARKAIDASV